MKDPRPNMLTAAALMVGLAALFAGPVQARPDDTRGSTLAPAAQTATQQPYDGGVRSVETPTILPYLSHGLGLGAERGDGAPVASRTIPYLSHGIGVDASQFQGLRGDDGVNRGWYTGLEYRDLPQPAATGDGFGWRDGGVTAAAGALLLALVSAAFVTSRQRARVATP